MVAGAFAYYTIEKHNDNKREDRKFQDENKDFLDNIAEDNKKEKEANNAI